MQLTPAIKGQLTKALKQANDKSTGNQIVFGTVRNILARQMPKEQAKHAARKYLATRCK